jgi:hypothetical protein
MLSARAWCMVMAARVAPPATPTIALQKLLRVLALDQTQPRACGPTSVEVELLHTRRMPAQRSKPERGVKAALASSRCLPHHRHEVSAPCNMSQNPTVKSYCGPLPFKMSAMSRHVLALLSSSLPYCAHVRLERKFTTSLRGGASTCLKPREADAAHHACAVP